MKNYGCLSPFAEGDDVSRLTTNVFIHDRRNLNCINLVHILDILLFLFSFFLPQLLPFSFLSWELEWINVLQKHSQKEKKSNRKKSMKAEREKKEISSDFSLFKGRKEINCYNDNTHTSDNKLKGKNRQRLQLSRLCGAD